MRKKELWQKVEKAATERGVKQYKYLYRRMLDENIIRKAYKKLRKGKIQLYHITVQRHFPQIGFPVDCPKLGHFLLNQSQLLRETRKFTCTSRFRFAALIVPVPVS